MKQTGLDSGNEIAYLQPAFISLKMMYLWIYEKSVSFDIEL